MNALEKKVSNICKQYAKNYDDGMTGFIRDLNAGGCASGLVGELVYYSDTVKFYNRYKVEINELLKNELEDTDQNLYDLFSGKWDMEDPLALDEFNQNLLAWFAFEKTAFNLFDR